MRFIRLLLILSSIFLFIECIGFFIHYSYHNDTKNNTYNEIFNTINIYIIENKDIHLSDLIIHFGFISFLLCSVGAYYTALHRFLFTNKQTNSFDDTQTRLLLICLVCYLIISLTCITFSILNLFITLPSQNNVLYYYLLICFDIQLILSSIPVFSSLSQVIAMSRDSAKSVRWSVTSVSPSKLFYKMSVKAVRMGMENIILNILLLIDIAFDLYEIIKIKMSTSTVEAADVYGIPCNVQAAHLIILYFLQLFLMLFTIDYTWVNRKYITVKNITHVTHHVTAQRYRHNRNNFSDFDYNNTVLKHIQTNSGQVSTQKTIVPLKAAKSVSPDHSDESQRKVEDMDHLELEFLSMSDKVKVRSFSVSSLQKKQKLHQEIIASTHSLDDSNMDKIAARHVSKNRSVFLNSISKAAKRMSRSFVESVIAADKIWDIDDDHENVSLNKTNSAERRLYSRYNKSKSAKSSKKSRRNSMPSVNEKKIKSKRKKSLSLKENLKENNTFICPRPTEMPSSPVSVLDGVTKLAFVANMTPIEETKQEPRTCTLPNFSQKLAQSIPSESIVSNASTRRSPSNGLAAPKVYSPRIATDDKVYENHGYNSSTSSGNAHNTNNKRKFFHYNHKLLFSDRPSDSVSGSRQNSAEISQFSEISEFENKMELVIKRSNKMDPIEESKSQKSPRKKAVLDIKTISVVSNVSVEHINDIYHASNVSHSNTLMADMEQILNDIDIESDEDPDDEDDEDDNNNCNNLMKNSSLQIDVDVMDEVLQLIEDEVLQSIEDEAVLYTQ